MRTLALFGAIFAFVLAFAPTCAIQGCALHHPADVVPGWPEESPMGAAVRCYDEAGTVSPCDAGHE